MRTQMSDHSDRQALSEYTFSSPLKYCFTDRDKEIDENRPLQSAHGPRTSGDEFRVRSSHRLYNQKEKNTGP